MRRLWCVIGFLSLPGVVAAQTDPCAAPRPAFTVLSSRMITVVQRISDYDRLFNGGPVLTAIELAVFPRGADPNGAGVVPVASVVSLKAAWTAVGTFAPNCYRAAQTLPTSVLVNVEYDLYARALKDSTPGLWFDQSERVPFGLPGPPAAPTSLRLTRWEPPSRNAISSAP